MFGLLLFGCKSYVQVLQTNSSIETDENGVYVYENDSLKISYSFWQEKGLMTFSIYNKLDKPLYIDWKKSSYIDNSIKLDYWVNEERSESSSSYGSYYYDGPLLKPGYVVSGSSGAQSTSTVKVERITFIPPLSNYYRSQFYILPDNILKLSTSSDVGEVPRNGARSKSTKIYRAYFTKENSPLIFRNFLTLSYSEAFESEFYVDNAFYIQHILEMDKRHFQQEDYNRTVNGEVIVSDKSGNPIMYSEFKDPISFYLYISKEESVEWRK